MKKATTTMAKGRRQEMKLSLATVTIERWAKLWADNDYQEIAKMVNPPTTPVNVGNYLKQSQADSTVKIPHSIAKAITIFYKKKAAAQDVLDAA